MALCQHISIKAPKYGSTDDCASCKLPIIFDGKRWVWELGIDRNKVRKMRRAYNIDQLTANL